MPASSSNNKVGLCMWASAAYLHSTFSKKYIDLNNEAM